MTAKTTVTVLRTKREIYSSTAPGFRCFIQGPATVTVTTWPDGTVDQSVEYFSLPHFRGKRDDLFCDESSSY